MNIEKHIIGILENFYLKCEFDTENLIIKSNIGNTVIYSWNNIKDLWSTLVFYGNATNDEGIEAIILLIINRIENIDNK